MQLNPTLLVRVLGWLTCAFASTAARAGAYVPPTGVGAPGLDAVVGAVWPLRNATLEFKLLEERLKEATASAAAARGESPLSVSTTTTHKELRPPKGGETPRSLTSDDVQTTVKYTSRSSLSATTTLGTSYLEQNTPSQLPDEEFETVKAKTHTLSGQVSYDVLKGGNKGANAQSALAAELSERQRIIAVRRDETEIDVRIFSLIVDYFVSTCKRRRLETFRNSADELVQVGKAKADARVISTRDLMTFGNTRDTLERRIQDLGSSLVNLESQADTFSAELGATLRTATKAAACAVDLKALVARTPSLSQQPIDPKALPEIQQASLARQAAAARKESARITQKPSVSPFVQGDYGRQPDNPQQKDRGSLSLGVALDWVIPTGRESAQLRAAAVSHALAEMQVERDTRTATARIAALKARIDYDIGSLPETEKALANARELAALVEAQFRSGATDALSYYSSSTSLADAEMALLDRYASLAKALSELARLAHAAGGERRP